MHIIFCMYLLLVRFLEHKYSQLFYVNKYVLSCYITFIFIVGTMNSILLESLVIKSILLVCSFVCCLLINISVFSSQRDLEKFNVKSLKTYISKYLIVYFFMWLTSLLIRNFLTYLIGIEFNNSFYMEVFVYILLISCVLTNSIILFMVHLYKSENLKINMFINMLIKNLSYQNIVILVFSFNLFFIFKQFFFELILNNILNRSNLLCFDSNDSDQDGEHDSVSDDELRGNSGGSDNGGPNQDITMLDVNHEESSNDESDHNEYKTVFNFNSDETRVKYNNISDIPSYKWGGGFWDNFNTWKGWAHHKIGSSDPNVDKGYDDIKDKRLFYPNYTNYNPIYKTANNGEFVLVDSSKNLFSKQNIAKKDTTLALYKNNLDYLDNLDVDIGYKYHKAYFDDTMVMTMLN